MDFLQYNKADGTTRLSQGGRVSAWERDVRIGIIDVGTNTARLAVFDAGGERRSVVRRSEITRLGEDVNRTRRLKPAAAARTFNKVREYVNECAALKVERIVGAGTSVLRDAGDAEVFVELVRALGVDFRVVPGETEARLVYAGAAAGLGAAPDAPLLVMDQGGGSTEFIMGRGRIYDRAVSLDIGAVRMTEQFLHTDPPTTHELEQMEMFASEMFQSIARQFTSAPGSIIAAVGGTAATLAALHLGGYNPDRVHGLELTREIIESLYHNLAARSTQQRAALPGMEPKRADIIAAGAGNYVCLLRALNLPGFRVSLHDIRHGLLEFVLSGEWDALPDAPG